MQGEFDILLEGRQIGKLSVRPDRGYTLFSARCKMINGLLRLSIYGEGREGYLGVAIPKDGELCLEKRFSPLEMRDFPKVIEAVKRSGQSMVSDENADSGADEANDLQPAAEATEAESEERDISPLENAEEDEGIFWYASADGALVSSGKGHEMIALPSGDGRIPKNIPGEKRIIEGREYFVFRTTHTDTSD